MKRRKKTLAAIDIGTNSFHLIVAELTGKGASFSILDREKETVRLGEGGMKRLTPGAVKRGLKTLKKFRITAKRFDAPVRAVATSAVREAENRKKFIDKVKKETGISIEVISGKEEARLIYKGVLSALPAIKRKKILLIDIGGGSTEFLIGEKGGVLYSASLKLGAVRLTDNYFEDGYTEFDSVRRCKEHIRRLLRPVGARVKKERPDIIVGTSGTILNIARMCRIRREGERRIRNGNFAFTHDELYELTGEILGAHDAERRAEIDGIDPGRMDIITSGVLILREAFSSLDLRSMTIARAALREGLIVDSVEKGIVGGRANNVAKGKGGKRGK